MDRDLRESFLAAIEKSWPDITSAAIKRALDGDSECLLLLINHALDCERDRVNGTRSTHNLLEW